MHFNIILFKRYKCELRNFNSIKISKNYNVTNKVISKISIEWMDMTSNYFMKVNYIAVRKIVYTAKLRTINI